MIVRNRQYGDNISPQHRTALGGNAMVFSLNRWVQLTAGTDSLPQLHSSLDYCYILNFKRSSGGHIITQETNPSGGLLLQTGLIQQSGGATYRLTFTYTASTRRENQQINFGRLSALENGYFGCRLANVTKLTGVPINQTIGYIDIGRRNAFPSFVTAGNVFAGHVRSIEILARHLTPAELRRVFNYGTAHAAGLITPADISIDFNRVNGQAPICRPGSRQLTVTPYNNTTPDTAGTTYADYYLL